MPNIKPKTLFADKNTRTRTANESHCIQKLKGLMVEKNVAFSSNITFKLFLISKLQRAYIYANKTKSHIKYVICTSMEHGHQRNLHFTFEIIYFDFF